MPLPRLLVVEGNTAEGRALFCAAGGAPPSESYAWLLRELLPDEWLAASATGPPERCARAVLGQFDLGADGVILHGCTPAELEPVVAAYRTVRPGERFAGLPANPGRSRI